MIILRQTHPSYSFEWHDEKSVLFSRNTCRYNHSAKKRKSGILITIILIFLIFLTSVLSYALAV